MTGGTGDVKPQLMTFQSTGTSATTVYDVSQIQLPVSRIGQSKSRATVFEILKVWWYIGLEDVADAAAYYWAFLTTATNRVTGGTSSLATLGADLNDPRVVSLVHENKTITTSGQIVEMKPVVMDLTDSNGNGVLVATQSLSLVHSGVGQATATNATAKILYRLVNVSIEEYVGIVQSQQ